MLEILALLEAVNVNIRNGRSYIHTYVKNNLNFFPEFSQDNYSFSLRTSQTVNNSTFWNLTAGYRKYFFEQQDPHFKDNLFSYGDSSALAQYGATLTGGDGQRILKDDIGIFFDYGRVNDVYSKNENDVYSLDFDFTTQMSNHLFEFGGGGTYNLVRYYYINPIELAGLSDTYTLQEKYEQMQPSVFGYNLYGTEKTALGDDDFAPQRIPFSLMLIFRIDMNWKIWF